MPKAERGYRTLLLPDFGRAPLLTQRERGLPFDVIFPSRKGTPRWPANVRTHWREIRGEDFAWVTPKRRRETAAAQLGHSTPDVTGKHYIDRAYQAGNYTAALDATTHFRRISVELSLIYAS
jgi:hypothetical protein